MLVKLLTVLACVHLATSQSMLPSRAIPGLPDNGIQIHGISIGALPDWSHEEPSDINRRLGAGMSIVGDYLNVGPNSYSLSQVEYHLPEVVRIARGRVKPVYAPALLYGANLDTWTDEITQAVAQKMKRVNDQGVTVWLRLLFEMNGEWMPYGQQPENFVRIWRDVTNAVRAVTNETFMLWAPNVWGADVGAVGGYLPYWPGEEYVDVTGMSFYSQGYEKDKNQPPGAGMFRDLFSPFYTLLNPTSDRQNRLNLNVSFPVVISETSAPYYYELPSSSRYYSQNGDTDIQGPLPNLTDFTPSQASPPFSRADDELYIKATWFVQLTSNTTAQRFPNLRAVSLFNYLKRGGEETEVLADFRAVGGNETVEAWFRGYIGNQTAYEEGYTGAGSRVGASRAVIVGVAFITMAFVGAAC